MSACNDMRANILMTQLLQEVSIAAAMEKIKAMPAGIVSFVLSRGFGVPISGKRAKLIELVLERYSATAVSEYRELVAPIEAVAEVRAEQRRVASRDRRIVREQLISTARERARLRVDAILREEDEIVSLYDGLQQRYDALVAIINDHSSYLNVMTSSSLMSSHSGIPYMNQHLTAHVMISIVEKLLTTIHRLETERASDLPDSSQQHEINVRLKEKIDSDWFQTSLMSGASSCDIYFIPAGIVHMVRIAKMYNYRRMLQADQSYFNYTSMQPQPEQVVYKAQMKTLNIRVVVDMEEREQTECGICYDKLPASEMVMTGCNHAFCSDCIGGFARTRGIKSFIKCPLCRTEIAEFSVSCQEKHAAVIAGLAPVPI